jgi:hypothetical protein
MTWIVFGVAAWPATALVAALVLGRAIGHADGFAATPSRPTSWSTYHWRMPDPT